MESIYFSNFLVKVNKYNLLKQFWFALLFHSLCLPWGVMDPNKCSLNVGSTTTKVKRWGAGRKGLLPGSSVSRGCTSSNHAWRMFLWLNTWIRGTPGVLHCMLTYTSALGGFSVLTHQFPWEISQCRWKQHDSRAYKMTLDLSAIVSINYNKP